MVEHSKLPSMSLAVPKLTCRFSPLSRAWVSRALQLAHKAHYDILTPLIAVNKQCCVESRKHFCRKGEGDYSQDFLQNVPDQSRNDLEMNYVFDYNYNAIPAAYEGHDVVGCWERAVETDFC